MTGPEDNHGTTRPISVAELLAKNGTIGAPPIGGRRRRRRGDTDSITVAELTGEIPVVRDHGVDEPATGRTGAAVVEEPAEAVEPSNAAVEHVDDTETVEEADTAAPAVEPDRVDDHADDYADDEAVYAAHIEEREARDVEDDLDFFAPPRRSSYAPRRLGDDGADTTVGAEEMSPDPLDWARDEEDDAEAAVDLAEPDDTDERDALPSYLRSSDAALFGGPTVTDDMPRRGTGPGPEDIDLEDDAELAPAGGMSAFLRGVWVVGQCILAVAFGAGLFVAFDQLWNWNSIVALVLGVLVILGLVVGVRVVRKTEDIASTLIAVAVGALVTFGPLALMKA